MRSSPKNVNSLLPPCLGAPRRQEKNLPCRECKAKERKQRMSEGGVSWRRQQWPRLQPFCSPVFLPPWPPFTDPATAEAPSSAEHVHTQMNLVSTFRLRSSYWWAQSQNLRGIRNHSWTEPQALFHSQDQHRSPSPKPTQHMCPGKRSNRSLRITQQCTLPQQRRRANSPNNLRTLCVWGPVGGTSELHNRRLTQFLFLGPRLFTSEMKSQ